MEIYTVMRKLNSQLEGVIVVIEELTVHIAQMDSEFDDLECQIREQREQIEKLFATSKMHRELLMRGHCQNYPCENSKAMEEDLMQQPNMVHTVIYNDPRKEEGVMFM